jgi:hypothetical protein
MPKIEFDGLPVIEVPDREEITVAVKPEDIQEGDEANPEQHPIAIALRWQRALMMRVSLQARGFSQARRAMVQVRRAKAGNLAPTLDQRLCPRPVVRPQVPELAARQR